MGQNPRLFSGTLRDNILLGKPQATSSEIKQAMDLAQLSAFIKKLPQGLDTPIAEGGLDFSGGQIQRIALARAFLKDAPLLLLDEPTASLDREENETLILEALDAIKDTCSNITLTHRLDNLTQAKNILLLKEGRIIEQGSFETLTGPGSHHFQQLLHPNEKST